MGKALTDFDIVERLYNLLQTRENLSKRDLVKFIDIENLLDRAKQDNPHELAVAKRWLKRLSRNGKKGHGH